MNQEPGSWQLESIMYNEKPPNNGHRLNILSTHYRNIGVDVYMDKAQQEGLAHYGLRSPLRRTAQTLIASISTVHQNGAVQAGPPRSGLTPVHRLGERVLTNAPRSRDGGAPPRG